MIGCDAKRRARAWSWAELKLSCKLLLDGEAAASTFESIIQRAVVEIRLTMTLFFFPLLSSPHFTHIGGIRGE